MAPTQTKTAEDRLRDAEEIIRIVRRENLDQKRHIATLQREEDTAEKIRRVIFGLSESAEKFQFIFG